MRLKVLTLTLAVTVSACSEDPVQPTGVLSPTASAAAQSAGANRSIVEFNGQLRKDFRNQVAALGGRVDFVAEGVGFAGVSGLTGNPVVIWPSSAAWPICTGGTPRPCATAATTGSTPK